MKKLFTIIVLFFIVLVSFAQSKRTITKAEQQPETSPLIVNRINEWQDLKFGFFAHWGIYATQQLVESWSI